MITCPECDREISSRAEACPHCGCPISPSGPVQIVQAPAPPQRKWNPGIAALLSLVIPGAGQMYKGQVFNGLVWLVVVVIGYVVFVIPGLVLHLFCIIGAASGDPYK